MSVFTENKLYFNRKLGTERCIFADRISAGKQLARDIKNKIIPKCTFIVKEIPCPFVKGRIFPHVSRFVLSNRSVIDVVHVKPVYYLRSDGQWRDMMEAFSRAGNRNLTLKYEYLANAFIDFGYLNWLIKRCALLRGHVVYSGSGIPQYPVMLNTVSTFYPDPDPETATVDGIVGRISVDEAWADIRGGAGNSAIDTSNTANVTGLIQSSTTSNQWQHIQRFIFLFDASSITDTDTIDSAVLSFMRITTLADNFSQSVVITTSTPGSNTGLVIGDYAQLGSVDQSNRILISAFAAADVYTDFTLNATGLGNIQKVAPNITKFGTRQSGDIDNSAPTWASNVDSRIICYTAEATDTTSDPKLVVTHTASAFTSGGWYMPLMGIG